MKQGEILKASSEATNRFRKERVRESRALGKIDGRLRRRKGSTSSISFLRLHGSEARRGEGGFVRSGRYLLRG